jgi:flagellar biosynthesis protein FliQ
MTGPEVLDVARDGVVTLIYVCGPMMIVGLAVGVAIGLVQALTQIQEMTLVFVPKIMAIFRHLHAHASVHGQPHGRLHEPRRRTNHRWLRPARCLERQG